MKFFNIVLVAIISFSIIFSGCGSNKTAKGAGIGAAAGGLIGGIMGHAGGNTTEGILIGAAIGGAAGAAIGHYMDKQAEELQLDLKDAKVERVGEGIKITFPSGILFKTNSSDLNDNSKSNITSLATTLKKYADTKVVIQGHTDSVGSVDYNQSLSERRASSVADFVKGNGVDSGRLSTVGYGKTQPVADNATAEGRQKNRRVEIAIFADDKLKRMAKQGDL